MGFFADIIHDSKRSVGRTGLRGIRAAGPALRAPLKPAPPRQESLEPKAPAAHTFWEEEIGQGGAVSATAPPSTPEDRQVAGPSLSENTEDSDLAKVPEENSSSPAIGKWTQIGLKNRRDVTVRSGMRRDQNLHGLVSFGREVINSEDSSVVEPAAKRPGQNTRGKSVKATHRSRQAGQTTRAGTATPPISTTPGRTVSTAFRPAAPSAEMTPAAEPAAEKERTLPSARTAPAESAVLARLSAPQA